MDSSNLYDRQTYNTNKDEGISQCKFDGFPYFAW